MSTGHELLTARFEVHLCLRHGAGKSSARSFYNIFVRTFVRKDVSPAMQLDFFVVEFRA